MIITCKRCKLKVCNVRIAISSIATTSEGTFIPEGWTYWHPQEFYTCSICTRVEMFSVREYEKDSA